MLLAIVCKQISESSKQGGGSKYSLLSKAYHDVPCLSITCSNNDLFLIMHLSLNLSLNGIITDVGKCIIVLFKVIKTSFQSIFTTSHNNFLSSIIWFGVSCPKILNRWMLPAFLRNLTWTYCLTSEKNSNTVTVLENSFPLKYFALYCGCQNENYKT